MGKPFTDFVLEAASRRTGRADYTTKRDGLCGPFEEIIRILVGVDHTGGRYHDAPLAGDRLVPWFCYEHRYRWPTTIQARCTGCWSAYSESLDLYL